MLVLTADELRAAAKVSGASAPDAVSGGWGDADRAVADVVALRGLLARGLASARDVDSGIDVALTAAAHAVLGPLLYPDQVIEVMRAAPAGTRRWLVGQTGDTAVVAEEREPDVWRLRPAGGPAHQAALAIATELVAGLPPAVTVPAYAVSPAAVLADIEARVTVRLVGASTLTWLETGASGTWLARPGAAHEPNDLRTAELTAAGPAEIRSALADLLGTASIV
jgi:hypothetical protein